MEFIQYNNNPKNNKTSDSAIRTIATAINDTWENVYMELVKLGVKEGLMPNDKANVHKYLELLGYEKKDDPKRDDRTRYTVEEFCVEFAEENKVYIISTTNHMSLVKNKNLYDTWDCSYKSVSHYWIIGGNKNDN